MGMHFTAKEKQGWEASAKEFAVRHLSSSLMFGRTLPSMSSIS